MHKYFSKCGDVSMMGGYNVAGVDTVASKSYLYDSKLDRIIVEFDLYAIDTWDDKIFYVTGFGVKK